MSFEQHIEEKNSDINKQDKQVDILCHTKNCLKDLLKDKNIQIYTFALKLLKISSNLHFSDDFEDNINKLVIPEWYKGTYISDWLKDIKNFFPKESYRERRWWDSRGVESLTESIIIQWMHYVWSQKWGDLEANSDKLQQENKREIKKQSSDWLIDEIQEKELSEKNEVYVKQRLTANRYRHTETEFEYNQSNITREQKQWLQEVPALFAQERLLKHKQRVEKIKTYQYIDIYQRLHALHMYNIDKAISYISEINSVTKRMEEYREKWIISDGIYKLLKEDTDMFEVRERLDIYNDFHDQRKKWYIPASLHNSLSGKISEAQNFLIKSRDKVAYIELAFKDKIINEKQRNQFYLYSYRMVYNRLHRYYCKKRKLHLFDSFSYMTLTDRKTFLKKKDISEPIYENSVLEGIPDSIFRDVIRRKK